jgi:PAS domain S-box-containing protein
MKEVTGRFSHVILNSIADGVFTTDTEGRITFINKAALQITGYSNREALGRFCFDVFRADICQTGCALKETLRTKREITNLPVTILNKKGKRIPISISTAVLRNEHGRVIGGVESFRDLSALEELRKELDRSYTTEDIISKNHRVHEILAILPDIAESDSTVLIQGQSGTGKELFAKAIHHLSRRRDRAFVKINCGALPDTLLESELFGYSKGAFTDAKKDKPGRFTLAHGGTLLLDEVGDMSPPLQVKLLRVLQEKEFEPLGATAPRKADVRVIAATHRDLAALMKERKFREDLFYRLNVIRLDLPPLAQRREDIPLLIDAFIQKLNVRMGKQIAGLSENGRRILLLHDYPGNIRELENILEHAFVLCRSGLIDVDSLPAELVDAYGRKPFRPSSAEGNPIGRAEAEAIQKVLIRHGGNRLLAAGELGIDRSTLWRKIRKYGLGNKS